MDTEGTERSVHIRIYIYIYIYIYICVCVCVYVYVYVYVCVYVYVSRTIQKTLKQRCFSDLLALQRALQKGCTNAVFRSLQQCIFVTA